MSAIQKSLIKLLDLDAPKGDDRQGFLKLAVSAINKLSDKEYEQLDQEEVSWFNSCCDVMDANKKNKTADPLPDLPDYKAPEEEAPARSTRRGAAKDEPAIIKIGSVVTLTTVKGREVTGKLIERDKNGAVIDVDGKEKEYDTDEIKTIEQFNDGAGQADEAGGGAPQPGDTVKFTTKRGRAVEGELVSMDDTELVVKVDGDAEEFLLSRIDGEVERVGAAAAKEEEKPARSRRGAAEKEEPADAGKTRVVQKGGISVGQRVKELLAEDHTRDLPAVLKILDKEGIEHKEVTVKMNHGDVANFIKVALAAGWKAPK